MTPSVSIIIPVFNHAKALRRCLGSISRQTFCDCEVIVVDDGSEILLEFNDYALRTTHYLLRQPHLGASAARNRGAKEARGEFLLFCDADVIMAPQMLARMHETLSAHPEASYAYSSFKFGWKKFTAPAFDPVRLHQMNFIHTTSLIRRAHFPGWDESLKKFQDWDLWLTMREHGHTGVSIPDTLFSIKPRLGGMSRWIPRFGYRWPWRMLWPKTVSNYEHWRAVIAKKHSR